MLMHSFANIDKAWNRNILLIDNTKVGILLVQKHIIKNY